MAATRAGRKGTNPDYLQELNGRYFVRVVVPRELRATVGRNELRAALGPDRRHALANRHGVVAAFLDRIAAARREIDAKTPDRITRPLSPAAMAVLHYREELTTDERMRNAGNPPHQWADVPRDPEFHRLPTIVEPGKVEGPRIAPRFNPLSDEPSAARERAPVIGQTDATLFRAGYEGALRKVAAGLASDEEAGAVVGWAVDKFRDRGNTRVEAGSIEWRELARTLALVELERIGRSVERDRGDFTGSPRLPILKEDPSDLTAPDPVPLLKLLDAYLVERAKLGKGAEARRRWTPVFRQLVTYLGHDDAEAITPEKAEEWLADTLGRKAAKTVRDTDLGALKAVYRWALKRKRVTHNPFAEITLEAPKARRTREKGFTDDEAKAVLKAARHYQPAPSSNPRTRESASMTAAKRWAPWLCAHTGARIAEMTQLRREDVQERDGVPFIRITPEAGSVKTGEFRDVPVHPQLVELGFLDFVREASPGPLFFDGSTKRKPGAEHPSKSVGKRVATWVRGLGVVGEVDPNHGWRHRMKTTGRELGVDSFVVDAIQGHAGRTAGENYGDVPLKAKAAVINRFPHFSID